MLKPVPADHPLFSTAAYQKDKVSFSLMEVIRQQPLYLASDGRWAVVGMSSPHYPAWVWTDDAIPQSAVPAVIDCCSGLFDGQNRAQFVAKPAIAAALSARFGGQKGAVASTVQMQSFHCPQPVPPKNRDLPITQPVPGDESQLADYLRNFDIDCFGELRHTGDLKQAAARCIESGRFYIIRRPSGLIAAVAERKRDTDQFVAIGGVYTMPAYRGGGFAAALVYHIAQNILADGKIPCLYTDLANPSSNRAYQNVGFAPCGRVDELTLTW
ncbi:GNAT family N-acetyltransferase [Neobittarella massiliensis]|uniref:GNAT family N-acetyltransferase n=1 Tax=Neobittarella massiliensis (ex Bilen et al. 2018) TaxID=2041842 RepID=A0A8J6IR12_9FIRM|nr:GNAT family N-acetyltransferase [Neobittarella massiliensis]